MPHFILFLFLSTHHLITIQNHKTITKDGILIVTDTSCLPPENYGVVNITSTGSRIVWTDVPSATQYRIQVSQTNSILSDTILQKTYRYDLSRLHPEKTYKFQIIAICGNKASIPSDWIEWQTLPLPECQTPMNLNVPWTTDSSARLDWMPSPGTTGYILLYKHAGSIIWDSLFSNTAGYTLKNLNASSAYQLSVKAICGTRQSERSTMVSLNTPTRRICDKPELPKLDELNQNVALWLWNKPKHATRFEVLDRLPEDSGWRTWQTFDTTISIPIRVPGKAIELKVRSHCNNIRSDFTPLVRTNTRPILDSTDVHEYNDLPHSAALIFPPVNLKGNLIQAKDQDWFRFENPVHKSDFLFVISNAADNLELTAMDDSFQSIKLYRMTNENGSNNWKGNLRSGLNFIRITRRIDTTVIGLSSHPMELEALDDLASSFLVQSRRIHEHNCISSWDTLRWTIQYTGKQTIFLQRWHIHNNDNADNYPAQLIKNNSVVPHIPSTSTTDSGLSESQCMIQEGETFEINLIVPSNTFSRIDNDLLTPVYLFLEKMELSMNKNYHLKVFQLDIDASTE